MGMVLRGLGVLAVVVGLLIGSALPAAAAGKNDADADAASTSASGWSTAVCADSGWD